MEKVYIDYFKEEPCKDCNAIENCKSLGIECALREHYIDAMPKQEAIERMAKRLEYEGVNKFECHTIAKWCLDELLRGVK